MICTFRHMQPISEQLYNFNNASGDAKLTLCKSQQFQNYKQEILFNAVQAYQHTHDDF